jgi:low temperature requirement protein LtrA
MSHENTSVWWGAPKKFSTKFTERKISWLELFYDLVYVVAISKINQYFSEHTNASGFIDYVYLFVMIFWGWFNGSMYHDLHGTPGIRTRLTTLWQMVAVAAMIVCLNGPQDGILFRGTIAIMVMQLYITYLWWSVGIYDKAHRKLNRPYTVLYLMSLGLIFSSLFLQQPYIRIVFFCSLF